MTSGPRTFMLLGSIFAFLGVAAGAFGAHSLKALLTTDMLAAYDTAVRYQMYHALGLLVVGWGTRAPQPLSMNLAGWLFVTGILLFSGSLYVMSLSGIRWIGAMTPLGGLAFLAGWGLLAWTAFRRNDER
jgi:uncharacterized membrane protein YgdD (TMEM256/DUF423 family)